MPHTKEISPHMHGRVYTVLVTQIYMRMRIGIVATVINASLLAFILWRQIDHWKLSAWLCLIFLASASRLYFHFKFQKSENREADIRRWDLALFWGVFVQGLLWGATAIFLFPVYSVSHQVFVAFVLAGMVAGAVGVYSPIIPVFLAFSVPVLTPVTIRFLLFGDEIHLAMGTMTVLFAVLTYSTTKRINRSTRELVELQETFADQLDSRTMELEQTNRQLRKEIDERRRAEQELADSRRRLTDIIEFLPDPTWVIDGDGRVLAWNRAIERITGVDKRQIIGKGDYAHAVPLYGKPRPMLIDLALRRNKHWEGEHLSIKEKNGLLVASESFHPSMGRGGLYFSSTASRLYDAQGHVVGAIQSMRDVTDARHLEQERERLIDKLQTAVAKARTLSGLLPICASCKNIRDDKGYWKRIEAFISEHSEAEFSHSICPDCIRKLYPDFDIPTD